jgi:hypothetical protein
MYANKNPQARKSCGFAATRNNEAPSNKNMKQPTNQRERNEDKKNPEENPSRGIDPESEEQQMEVVDQDPGERQKENQDQKKDDDLAA